MNCKYLHFYLLTHLIVMPRVVHRNQVIFHFYWSTAHYTVNTMHVFSLSFKANTDVSAANFTFVATRMLTSHIAEKYLMNSFCGFSPLHHGPVTIMTQNHREQVSKTGRLHLAAVPVWSLSRRRSAQSLAGTHTSQTDEPGDSGTQQPAILLSDMIRQCPCTHANRTPLYKHAEIVF